MSRKLPRTVIEPRKSATSSLAVRCVVVASVQVLAIIKDHVPGMASETVCGGQSRQRHVMLSESHDVEVRMVLQSRRDELARYILIRYEGNDRVTLFMDHSQIFFNYFYQVVWAHI